MHWICKIWIIPGSRRGNEYQTFWIQKFCLHGLNTSPRGNFQLLDFPANNSMFAHRPLAWIVLFRTILFNLTCLKILLLDWINTVFEEFESGPRSRSRKVLSHVIKNSTKNQRTKIVTACICLHVITSFTLISGGSRTSSPGLVTDREQVKWASGRSDQRVS